MDNIFIIYFGTAVISFLIALLLVYFSSRFSAHPKVLERKSPLRDTIPNTDLNKRLEQTISSQLKGFVKSRQSCEEISRMVVDIFDETLNVEIDRKSQEVEKKYKVMINHEKRNEEMAWQKYNKALSEKQETEAVIHSIAEGLVVVDQAGKVIMMNPAAEKLLGVLKKDKIGRPILENIKEEQLVSFAKRAENKQGGAETEIELASSNAETKKILRSSSAIIENQNGQTVGMVSVLSDITKQKELEKIKSDFIATASHELRTPLISMEKSISLLLSKTTGVISERQEEFLLIVRNNLKRLMSLANDLLDLSKLEIGKLELRRQSTSMADLINQAIEGLDAWAKTKSIKIEKNIQADMPSIDIDPDRIMQVLNNLIGNSVKFTPQDGKITIGAKLSEADYMEVSVQDTGTGIGEKDLPKIFDRFYKGTERPAYDISGAGIGLSISKEIIELHKGKIWAENVQGSAAKFIFTLPLKSA